LPPGQWTEVSSRDLGVDIEIERVTNSVRTNKVIECDGPISVMILADGSEKAVSSLIHDRETTIGIKAR
jgi:hypothetical protein